MFPSPPSFFPVFPMAVGPITGIFSKKKTNTTFKCPWDPGCLLRTLISVAFKGVKRSPTHITSLHPPFEIVCSEEYAPADSHLT